MKRSLLVFPLTSALLVALACGGNGAGAPSVGETPAGETPTEGSGSEVQELDEDDIDENIRPFIDDALVSIFAPPSFEALVSISAPELPANSEELIDEVTQRFGSLKDYEIVHVNVIDSAIGSTGEPIRVAFYQIDGEFEGGCTEIQLAVIKREEDLLIFWWDIPGISSTEQETIHCP